MKNHTLSLALFQMIIILVSIFCSLSKENVEQISYNKDTIRNMVRPPAKQYQPQIVESLNPSKIIIASPHEDQLKRVQTVQTTNPKDETSSSGGFEDKPQIFTTVVYSKPTEITRSPFKDGAFAVIPQRKESKSNNLKKAPIPPKPEVKEELMPGQFALSVKVQDLETNDPTKKRNYEKPELITDPNNTHEVAPPVNKPIIQRGQVLNEAFKKIAQEDLTALTTSLADSKTEQKTKTVKHLLSLREGLNNEAKKLLELLRTEIDKTEDVDPLIDQLNQAAISIQEKTK